MRQIKIISDISGKEVTDHVMVTINKPGYMLKQGNALSGGSVTLDMDSSELPDLHKALEFVEVGKVNIPQDVLDKNPGLQIAPPVQAILTKKANPE